MPSTASLVFDGVNDEATTPNHADLNITGDMTIEFWAKLVNWQTDRETIGGIDFNGGNGQTPYIIIAGSFAKTLRYTVGTGTYVSETYVLDTSGLTNNTWHHFAFTRTSNVVNGYIDGVVQGSPVTFVNTPVATAEQVRIGKNIWDNYLNGKLDEFRIWNVARSATQIADYYAKKAIGTETGLVACWHFDEGTGTTAGDAAGTAQDLTLTNGPTWDTSDFPTLTDAASDPFPAGYRFVARPPQSTLLRM